MNKKLTQNQKALYNLIWDKYINDESKLFSIKCDCDGGCARIGNEYMQVFASNGYGDCEFYVLGLNDSTFSKFIFDLCEELNVECTPDTRIYSHDLFNYQFHFEGKNLRITDYDCGEFEKCKSINIPDGRYFVYNSLHSTVFLVKKD